MIKLERTRTKEAIHASFRGKKRIELEKHLLLEERRIKRDEIEKHDFDSKWGVVKNQLLVESSKKCAYCETPTAVVAYGDVEHYRPKSVYWWLAYNYDNYLASCTLCNQKYKKAKFPVLNQRMKSPQIKANTTDQFIESKGGTFSPDPLNNNEGLDFNEFINRHNAERPLLVNPYFEDPVDFYSWKVDTVLEEVELVPIPDNDLSKKCVKAAEKAYGLNRQELKRLRYEIYLQYSTHRLYVSDPGSPQRIKEKSQSILVRMLRKDHPYLGMLNFFESVPVDELP